MCVEKKASRKTITQFGTPMDFKGKFIVLDGPDGCGKSTQAQILRDYISANGAEAVSFRDPGGTHVGEKIREILLDPENHINSQAEMLLYMASRAQLWSDCISPALSEGKCVVMDRWLSATCAYQGYAGNFGMQKVITLAENCLERLWPDALIILDIDTETALARMDRELDRMELKGQQYHEKVREGFLKLSEIIENIDVTDATKSIEDVSNSVLEIINKRIA